MEGDIITLLSGGLAGSLLTLLIARLKNRLQVMKCHYIADEVLSKIPQHNEDETINHNLYCKRFKLKNTTNRDIESFKVSFQFDPGSHILECYSQSKEGYNYHKIKPYRNNPNVALASIRNFNRGDAITYCIKIANISENNYYVSEAECVGFKIRCRDKRKRNQRTDSHQSNEILIERRQ